MAPSIIEVVAPYAAFEPSDAGAGALLDEIHAIIEAEYAVHPFSKTSITKDNAATVLRQYIAMSQAFPYLQAGVGKDFIFKSMENNTDMPKDIERTFVVGMFICWDECGGNYLLQKEGMQSLPKILSTGRFHCNMLRSDIRPIFKEDLKPDYSQVTTTYLKGLYERLASHDPIVRASMMVAFEIQGAHMIESLGKALVGTYNLEEEDLSYCQAHVGGDDPLEVYHIAMTKKLLSTIVTQKTKERFINEFRISYALNFDWCRDITL